MISNKLSQVSPLDKISYLLLYLEAILSVVSMILVELTILALIPLEGVFIFLGHFTKSSFLISMGTWAIGVLKGDSIRSVRQGGVREHRSLILL